MPIDGPVIKPGLGPPAQRPGGLLSQRSGTSVVVGGRDLTDYLKDRSLTLKHNTFDFVLVDDPQAGLATLVAPLLGDIVHLYEPAWTGVVSGIKQADVKRGTVRFFAITATNTDEKYASPAPFGLSDVPNGATTYGYADLSMSQARTSSGDETRGSLTVYAEGLWPAMTFTLTSANFGLSAAEFSVSDVTVTWPKKGEPVYRVDFGDALVTLSAWAVGVATDSILPITTTKITDGAVTTPKVAANAITASTIAAGAITADKLAATLVLGTLITSGLSGRRWEGDSAGVRLYDASDGLLVNIPTDGSPVYVSGQINASSLVVSGNAEFQGTGNQLSQLSSTTAQAGVQPPTAAPSLNKGWPAGVSLAAPTVFGFHAYIISGGYYDTAGGADGATACWVALAYDSTAGAVYVIEWKVSDGSVDRTTALTGGGALSFTDGQGFVTRIGANWYVRCLSGATREIAQVTRGGFTAGAVTATYTTAPIGLALTNDGTFVYDMVLSGGTYYIQKYDTTPAFVSRTAITNLPASFASGQDLLLYADIGAGNHFYIGDSGNNNILEVSTAYAVIANTEIAPAKALSHGYGFIWDGTQFQHAQWTSTGASTVSKYTNWTWTTASPIYWVGYAWYDSAGTTHETAVGPRQSITMGRRQQLTVGNAAIPVGGVDDPNNVRVYMLPNATDPGAGAFKLQATDALTTRALTTYNAAGAADGGGTPFVGGIGAVLQSAGTGWTLRGNGSMNLGGASFPGSPVTGDVYYRTDHDLLFKYDGTNWLSTDLFVMKLDGLFNQSVTLGSQQCAPCPTPSGGSDIFLVDLVAQFLVNAGTALSGSHKWVGTFNKQPTGNTNTLLVTITIDSGASSVWRVSTTAIDALMNAGTVHYAFSQVWTKTGTPGNLFLQWYCTYRIVAT